MKYGLPYANGLYLMDQPPLGFYIQAVFSKGFGFSINNGTFLGDIVWTWMYRINLWNGKSAYNKTTGFFAASLFAFSPWHLILSRSFLIDVPCLFFSLLSLVVGIIAVRKEFIQSFCCFGICFRRCFQHKIICCLYSYSIIRFFFYYSPKNLKRIVTWLLPFLCQ